MKKTPAKDRLRSARRRLRTAQDAVAVLLREIEALGGTTAYMRRKHHSVRAATK